MNCVIKHRLDGKVAVVTASSYGIGFAIAERLAQEGAKVVVSSRKQENVDTAVAKLKNQNLQAAGVVCHVSKLEDRKKLYDEAYNKFGGIDILVSNAGVNPAVGPTFDCTESQWDKIFDVNLKSAFMLTKEILPYFKKRGGGKIVYISTMGAYDLRALLGAYCVSKVALNGLAKVAGKALASENITVNCLAPGHIETQFSAIMRKTPDQKRKEVERIPMKRFGDAKEMAGIAAFLVSDDAAFITGETILAAGGLGGRL